MKAIPGGCQNVTLSEFCRCCCRAAGSGLRQISSWVRPYNLRCSKGSQEEKDDFEIAMSVPEIGSIAAIPILAEIGNYKDFSENAR